MEKWKNRPVLVSIMRGEGTQLLIRGILAEISDNDFTLQDCKDCKDSAQIPDQIINRRSSYFVRMMLAD